MEPEWPEHFQPNIVREGFGGKLSSYTIALEAWRRGLKVTFLDPELRKYRLEDDDGLSVTFIRSRPHMTTKQSVQIANNKHRTNQLLQKAGVPAPASRLIETAVVSNKELAALAEEVGYPVVLKPLDGSMGQGVFANIRNQQELKSRYKDLLDSFDPDTAILESHMPGDDYRVLVYKDAVIGACLRLPANVVGDGKQTVQQLINEKNTLRKENPFLSKGLIRLDHEVKDSLSRQGYSYESVPPAGERLQLRSAANASAGGDVVDVTDELPVRIKAAAVDAVRAIPGLFCAGVDVLFDREATTLDHSYTVLELNAHPQIGVNMYPTQGIGQDAPKTILDICFPESSRSGMSGDLSLSLPRLREFLTPLRNGAASAVSLATLRNHRFGERLNCRLEPIVRISRLHENRLLRTARSYDLAGALDLREGFASLVIAGGHKECQKFIRYAADLLEAQVTKCTPWEGSVAPGFTLNITQEQA